MSVTRNRSRATFAFAACAIGIVLTPSRAHAQTAPPSAGAKAACISAFEQATDLRAARKLLEARQRLLECGGVSCPPDVQKECAKELDLVNQSLPSIALAARDQAGRDVVDGRVLVDGVARELDGRSVLLDPGRHTVRFELTGCEPAEQLVLLTEGERNRPIIGALRCGAEPVTKGELVDGSSASAPSSSEAAASSSSGPTLPVLPIVLAGIGVVGIAGFAYFGTLGRSDIEDIRSTGCAPACNRDAVMDARTKLVVADVFGAVGLVSLGAAAYFAFVAPSSSAPSNARATTLDLRPDHGGATMTLRTRF